MTSLTFFMSVVNSKSSMEVFSFLLTMGLPSAFPTGFPLGILEEFLLTRGAGAASTGGGGGGTNGWTKPSYLTSAT